MGAFLYTIIAKKRVGRGNPNFRFVLLMSALVALLHHLILLEYSAIHDYATVKSGLLLSMVGGAILSKTYQLSQKVTFISIFLLVISCLAQYYYVNRIGQYSQNGDRYDKYQTIATAIRAQTTTDETIYIADRTYYTAELEFYLQRNLNTAHNLAEAQERLTTRSQTKGCLVQIEAGRVKNITHFEK